MPQFTYNPAEAARWHRRIFCLLLACVLSPLLLAFAGCRATSLKEMAREKPHPTLLTATK